MANDDPVYYVEAFQPSVFFAEQAGTPVTIGYAFKESGTSPSGQTALSMTAAEKQRVYDAVESLTADNGATMVEVANAEADILFAKGPEDPTAVGRTFYASGSEPVEVWAYDNYDTADGLANNTYIYIHELLHGLGLRHSTEYFGSSYEVVIPDSQDDGTTLFGNWVEGWQTDLQLFDQAALHYIYGPDPEQRAGNDSYTPEPPAFDPQGPKADWPILWDGEGNDALDFSGESRAVEASLAPGELGAIGGVEGDILAAGTFAVGYNTVIERLLGGAGDDTLSGSARGDEIHGNAGADGVYGWASDDLIYGHDGDDAVYGNRSGDEVYGNQGGDALFGGRGADMLFGGHDSDLAYGNVDADLVYGNFQKDTIFGGQGGDTLFGGQGNDRLWGNKDDDLLAGNKGDDLLIGGSGEDVFFFGRDNGDDRVVDFDGAAGDRIQTLGVQVEMTSTGNSTRLDFSDGGSALLEDVSANSLQDDWFI
jgi:Ca2+-binding RTX toxin-like protein